MQIVAYRGVHRLPQAENTIQAFTQAVVLRCPMFEFDVRRTKDCRFVVSHGDSINLKGHRILIKEKTRSELVTAGLVAANLLNEGDSLKPPTLELVLRFFLHQTGMNVEIKDQFAGEDLAGTLETLIENKKIEREHLRRLVVSSFHRENLEVFQRVFPEIETALGLSALSVSSIYQDYLQKWLREFRIGAIHMSISAATLETVAYFKKLGLKVLVYTVNDFRIVSQLEEMGVDGVFTDRAEEFLRLSSPLLSQVKQQS